MSSPRRAVTRESLGAWLFKASPETSLREHVASGFTGLTHRCARASRRTDLLAPGQPVLLWVSGHDPDLPAGLYAQGWTTGAVASGAVRGSTLDLPVRFEPLAPPVLRAELRAHPTLASIEVLRMPAGSNPSFLSRNELQDLGESWPQLILRSSPRAAP